MMTDEHPEVRSFIVNQGLKNLLGKPYSLESPVLAGITIKDCNESEAMSLIFSSLTTQALTFEEVS